MENRSLFSKLSALLLIVLLTSCNLFDKVDDVSFNTEFEESFVVNNSPAGTYSDVITLDATSDPEVNKYKEKIKGITVNKITYKVSNYDGPTGVLFSGDVLFGAGGALGSVEISDLNLTTASSSGEEFELNLTQDAVDKVANQLKDDKSVSVTMAGTFSDGPVSCVIELKVNAKVTADAL
jgi:hypothetical protein